jgi:SAM-dependent methyltransferase
MQSKEFVQQKLDELKRKYGEWTFDIPLPFDIWTNGNLQIPQTRLKRIIQIVHDLSNKPLSECRVLDLGCLDGIFSIEFALHGAETIGVEIREANIEKAKFCKEVLELHNLNFRQDDVRNISVESYGKFDAIICSGILYHLPAMDAINLIRNMFEMVNRILVIDTNVSLLPENSYYHEGVEYWGDIYREFPDDMPPEKVAMNLWASSGNSTSFWFTRPSLINILAATGFSSIYECFIPLHVMPERKNFEEAGIAAHDRSTFIAIKGSFCEIKTSPITNGLHQNWQEQSLSYTPDITTQDLIRLLLKNVLSKQKSKRE